jgi:hypothetical protein
MRALCGAIITAGAVIGLGLTALGIGTRYQMERVPTQEVENKKVVEPYLVHVSSMDRPLVYCLVFTSCVAVIGLGIAFVGLAYHHHRRYHEMVAAGHISPYRHAAAPHAHGDTGIQSPPPM